MPDDLREALTNGGFLLQYARRQADSETPSFIRDVYRDLLARIDAISAARDEWRRDERAAVVAFGSPTQFITWGKQVARFIDAIERGEHTKGEI